MSEICIHGYRSLFLRNFTRRETKMKKKGTVPEWIRKEIEEQRRMDFDTWCLHLQKKKGRKIVFAKKRGEKTAVFVPEFKNRQVRFSTCEFPEDAELYWIRPVSDRLPVHLIVELGFYDKALYTCTAEIVLTGDGYYTREGEYYTCTETIFGEPHLRKGPGKSALMIPQTDETISPEQNLLRRYDVSVQLGVPMIGDLDRSGFRMLAQSINEACIRGDEEKIEMAKKLLNAKKNSGNRLAVSNALAETIGKDRGIAGDLVIWDMVRKMEKKGFRFPEGKRLNLMKGLPSSTYRYLACELPQLRMGENYNGDLLLELLYRAKIREGLSILEGASMLQSCVGISGSLALPIRPFESGLRNWYSVLNSIRTGIWTNPESLESALEYYSVYVSILEKEGFFIRSVRNRKELLEECIAQEADLFCLEEDHLEGNKKILLIRDCKAPDKPYCAAVYDCNRQEMDMMLCCKTLPDEVEDLTDWMIEETVSVRYDREREITTIDRVEKSYAAEDKALADRYPKEPSAEMSPI